MLTDTLWIMKKLYTYIDVNDTDNCFISNDNYNTNIYSGTRHCTINRFSYSLVQSIIEYGDWINQSGPTKKYLFIVYAKKFQTSVVRIPAKTTKFVMCMTYDYMNNNNIEIVSIVSFVSIVSAGRSLYLSLSIINQIFLAVFDMHVWNRINKHISTQPHPSVPPSIAHSHSNMHVFFP